MSTEFFFHDEEIEDISLHHIEKIRELQERQAKVILKSYKRVRQELRDRLTMIQPGTFTSQKMQGSLLQINLAIDEMSRRLTKDMNEGAGESAELGIEHLITELEKFNKRFQGAVIPINLDAVAVASDTKNFLFNRHEASIRAYSETVRARLAYGLMDSVVAQTSLSETMDKVGKTFLGEEWKLQQITRTELHGIYNIGKINAMKELWNEGKGDIPDLMKTLFHPMDGRTGEDSKILNKNNPIVPIDEPFVEFSTGKRLEYMAPPNRPNDRAILIPYRDSWASR